MDLDFPFPANAIKDPFGFSGDDNLVDFAGSSPLRQPQPVPMCYPWGWDCPRFSPPPAADPFSYPWPLNAYQTLPPDVLRTIAPDEVMASGVPLDHQPPAMAYGNPSTPPGVTPDYDGTPVSLPQLLSDASDASDSGSDSECDSHGKPQAGGISMDNVLHRSSPYRVSDLRSSNYHEPGSQGSRHLTSQPFAVHGFGSLQLPATSLSSLPSALSLNLEAGEDDPFIDTSDDDESDGDPHAAAVQSSGSAIGTEEQCRSVSPSLPSLPSPTAEHEELSDDGSVDPASYPPSTRLVPGPGSAFSDDDYVASANESVDGEGEEELEDSPDSPPATPVVPVRAKRQASTSTSTKKTFKDGLWDAINNPEFEDDIFWAADGLSGEIPDRRQFERSDAMRAITDARNVGGFVRQLHMWGFHRFKRGGAHSLCFTHPLFRRDQPELRHNISRKGETKYRARRTKRKQKRSYASDTSTRPSQQVRKSSRTSTRLNYKEEQSPSPSSDPETGSDAEQPRSSKRTRRSAVSSGSTSKRTSFRQVVSASKPQRSAGPHAKKTKATKRAEDDTHSPSPEPATPAFSTLRHKTQRNHEL